MTEKGDKTEATPDGGEITNPTVSFDRIFGNYRGSIAAAREFFSQLQPVVVNLDEGVVTRLQESLSDQFAEAGAEAVSEVSALLVDMAKAAKEGDPVKIPFPSMSESAGRLMWRILSMFRSAQPPRHHELLNRSVLMMLVGTFEVLVSELAHAYYRLIPGATQNDEKTLSINDLRQFDSIDDALDSLVSKRVDDLLRDSLEDWAKFFLKGFKIKLDELCCDWPQWFEMFQRRHLIVHAGGRVTRRYLGLVDWEKVAWPVEAPAVGTELPIEDEYLRRALDLFETTGLLLCQSVWRSLRSAESGHRMTMLIVDAIYPRLLSGDWFVAELLSVWGAGDSTASDSAVLSCRFNRWLSIKRQGRWADVENEVASFDMSAKGPQFQLAWLSLRGRLDDFFRILPAAIAGGLTFKELRDWPIFEEVRGDPRYGKALSSHPERAERPMPKSQRKKRVAETSDSTRAATRRKAPVKALVRKGAKRATPTRSSPVASKSRHTPRG